MEVKDVIRILKEYEKDWREAMKRYANDNDYGLAQSYYDMSLGIKCVLNKIKEEEKFEEEEELEKYYEQSKGNRRCAKKN